MSAVAQTCYTLLCDHCQAVVYDDGEGRELHFESADAARSEAVNYNDWGRDDDRDLCPSCRCAIHGHVRRVVNGSIFCDRCGEDLLKPCTAAPNPAYL